MVFIKNFLAILALLFFASCTSQNLPRLGSKIDTNITSKQKVLNPLNFLMNSAVFKDKNGIEFTLGVDDENLVKYISTVDANFSVEGMKIGDKIQGSYNIENWPGWNKYIQVNSFWFATVEYSTKPFGKIVVKSFFKYDFIKK